MKFETFCKLCGESIEVPEEEHLLADDHIHVEGQIDKVEYKYSSPSDLF
jgi:hypothetical protein